MGIILGLAGIDAPTRLSRTAGVNYVKQLTDLFGSSLVEIFPLNGSPNGEVNALPGTATAGLQWGDAAFPAGGKSPFFDGNEAVDIQSASLAAAFNGENGGVIISIKLAESDWTNATLRRLIYLFRDANNSISIRHDPSATPVLIATYRSGGATKTWYIHGPQTDWLIAALTWSEAAGLCHLYVDGAEKIAAQTNGNWTGALTASVIGAGAADGLTAGALGNIGPVVILNSQPSQTQIIEATRILKTWADVESGAVPGVVGDWWSLPRASLLGDNIYYAGVGYVSTTVSPAAIGGTFTKSTGVFTRPNLATLVQDEHATPARLLVNGKPHILAYCLHNTDTNFRIRISSNNAPAEPTWNTAVTLTTPAVCTYAQIYADPASNRVVMLTRVNDTAWYYNRSENWGSSWAGWVKLFDFGAGKGYVASQQAGAVVCCALYGHPKHSSIHDIYQCFIDLGSGDVTSLAGGPAIANIVTGAGLPITVTTTLPMVYDTAEGNNIRLFDVSAGTTNPEIVFAEWAESDDVASYKVIRYNGASWDSTTLALAGAVIGDDPEAHYHAGASIGAAGTVYLARESGGHWYMERYTSADGWQTWNGELLRSSRKKILRPYPVVGGSGEIVYNLMQYYDDQFRWDGDLVFLTE